MDPRLASGTLLGGRYEIVELLDRGGHGAVYRARQKPLGREVAVKVMLAEVAAGPGMAERFAREVSLVQRLEHPNTVRLYDFGTTDDGTAFMVFELLRGRSLASEMSKGPMPAARVGKIAVQILKSLMEAHSLGIVHRDIKPANVLLVDYSGEDDFVKVLDFGVARPLDANARAITRDGQMVGTPAYMAPELVKDEAVTPRTDIYALGLVMGEMLAGQPIYEGDTSAKIWMQQAAPAPVPIPDRARVSPLGDVVERATRKEASQRFASAAEMIAAIEKAVRSSSASLAATDPLAPPMTVRVSTKTPAAPQAPTPVPTALMAPASHPRVPSSHPRAPSSHPQVPSSHPQVPSYSARGPTPMATARPPLPPTSEEGLFKVAAVTIGVVLALVTLAAGYRQYAHQVEESKRTASPSPQEPSAIRDDGESPFDVRRAVSLAGWRILFEHRGGTKETGEYVGYRVSDGRRIATVAVTEFPSAAAADRMDERGLGTALRQRSGRFVLLVNRDKPDKYENDDIAFQRQVFDKVKLP